MTSQSILQDQQQSSPSFTPLQLSFPLPRAAVSGTNIYLHVSLLERALLLFLTTSASSPSFAAPSAGPGAMGDGLGGLEIPTSGDGPEAVAVGSDGPPSATRASLGSFVCALPDRTNPLNTLSTPLYTQESTVDFTTRMARVLAKRLQQPVYVGNSISFAGAGMGGSVEEEMAGFKSCVDIVLDAVTHLRGHGQQGKEES